MKPIISIITIAILFCSCEKVVELDLDNNVDKLVVEGNITDQRGPYFVKLTKSVNFNDPNSYPPVTDALVVITDNSGQRDTLGYTSNGLYKTNHLQGVEGRTYFLNIITDGKTYTAQSKMPSKVNLDVLRLNSFQFNSEEQINVLPIYNDPSFPGNNYRFIQTINGKRDETYYAFNDNLNNGEINQRPLRSNDPDLELKQGDRVEIEMQCISPGAYTYYFSLSQQQGGGPGGASAPANPPNNIVGDALGLFSAHTTQTKTIIVP